MMMGILVRVGKVSRKVQFQDLDDVITQLGIGDEMVTFEIETMHGIGIIAHDQDRDDLKTNRLGIKGDFVILGMSRQGGLPIRDAHVFRGLTEDELSQCTISLAMTTLKDMGVVN